MFKQLQEFTLEDFLYVERVEDIYTDPERDVTPLSAPALPEASGCVSGRTG